MSTVHEIWGVGPTEAMLADKYYREGTTPVSAPDLVVGLELEIEKWEGENRFRGFSFKEDNSLRGSSIEAVTNPTKARYVETLLQGFFQKNQVTEDNYSERCGTHVHMNVSDLTLDQLGTFCLLYQVFERSLFKYVGVDRDNNIFCVPWEQAGVSYDLLRYLRNGQARDLLRGWRKYTALNLQPVVTFGSVEFRHLPGTCDVPYIMGWINLIGCMYNYAKSRDYKETQQKVIDLNTSSAYLQFANAVFGLYVQLLQVNNIQEDMETGVINVKLMSRTDLIAPAQKEKQSAYMTNPAVEIIDDWAILNTPVRLGELAQRPQAVQQTEAAQQADIPAMEALLRAQRLIRERQRVEMPAPVRNANRPLPRGRF